MVLQQNEEASESPGPPPLTVTAPVPYAPSGALRNPFPPIADYAFLSDCENTCLIASAGSVEWLCVPRPDSPSVFGAILDRGAPGVAGRQAVVVGAIARPSSKPRTLRGPGLAPRDSA